MATRVWHIHREQSWWARAGSVAQWQSICWHVQAGLDVQHREKKKKKGERGKGRWTDRQNKQTQGSLFFQKARNNGVGKDPGNAGTQVPWRVNWHNPPKEKQAPDAWESITSVQEADTGCPSGDVQGGMWKQPLVPQ